MIWRVGSEVMYFMWVFYEISNYQKSCPFLICLKNKGIQNWSELVSNFSDDFVVLDPPTYVDNYHGPLNT